MKKFIYNIIIFFRDSFFGKYFLGFFIYLNNISYRWIKVFVSKQGVHPKYAILNYDVFFKDNLMNDDIVFDIGCGNGFLAASIAEKVKEVVAIDISKENIEKANRKNKKNNIKYIVGDATNYDINKKFDAIALSNVLEHIENRIEFLKKIRKFSDKIILRVPMIDRDWLTVYKKNNGYEYRLDKTHFIEYTLESLEKELEESGWKLISYDIKFGELWGIINKI
ncbi:MAG: class I SAM-dependent methyltransferase [Patescibacteria group bacterium]|nr:class I SAM-dependent methyltransferase [Patescibacteria group bacterium]